MQNIRVRSYYAILLGIGPQVSIYDPPEWLCMVVAEAEVGAVAVAIWRTGIVSEAKKRNKDGARQSKARQSKAGRCELNKSANVEAQQTHDQSKC